MITPDFQNTSVAFRSRSTSELKKMRLLFNLMGRSELTNLGIFLIKLALRWHFPVKKLIKVTLFRQFCGGESLSECIPVMEKLYHHGVQCIPDFSAEADSAPDYDGACQEILNSIQFVSQHPSCAFAVFKASAIGPSALYEKFSDKTVAASEVALLKQAQNRIVKIAETAHRLNVRLLVDAEESWIQDWIDDQIKKLSMRINKEKPVLYLTFQLYRTDGLQRLKNYYAHAQAYNYFPAVKIVRGAYLEKERLRDATRIHPHKIATDVAYNAAIRFCIERGIALCAGSHNEDSTRLLTELYPVKKADVYFAQLYGMSDNLSFVLAEHQYPVAKYLPYGPVKLVMPYLFRRAEENKSVTGEMGRELKLIEKELKRRS